MFDLDLLLSLVIGIMVTTCLYMLLARFFQLNQSGTRRALGLFAGAAGFLTTYYLWQNPDLLDHYTYLIVIAALGVVLALLNLLRRIL